MTKRIIALLVCVFMVSMILAACGSTPSTSTTTTVAAEASTPAAAASTVAAVDPGAAETLAVDLSKINGSDGQPLFVLGDKVTVPERPSDPAALAETDAGHWWDMEFAGWTTVKETQPKSPANGAKGKKVTLIVHGDHPWTTAYGNGAKKAAEAYGMEVKIMSPNWDLNVQNQLIDQAINEKPDLIALIPVDAKAAVQQFRKIYQAGIPLAATNCLSEDAAMKYCLAWTGPDDWGQMRLLAQEFAKKMGNEGGYAIIQHNPGGSPFYSRTFGITTELAKVAPNMKLLDKQAPGFDAAKVSQLTADWITKYGKDLKGIVAADDSAQMIGIADACKKAGRTDIVIVAAGNSKVGMDALKAGSAYAMTYQTAEGDGAAAMRTAALYFAGAHLDPVTYLPKHIITQADVDKFMPAQW